MKLLVIRFSSLGDVALAAAVTDALLEANPNLSIWFLSTSSYQPLFNKNPRLHFVGADLKNQHKGIFGLYALFKTILSKVKFDAVVDIHDVIRTKFLLFMFQIKGVNTIRFDKGRKEKKLLLKGKIPFKKLPHTTERYLNAFKNINLFAELNKKNWLETEKSPFVFDKKSRGNVGIAPYAAHQSKEWGIKKITLLIERLSSCNIYLFGGGNREIKQLKILTEKFDNCTLISSNYSFKEELDIMAELDLMISMDSANMHLSALVGTKVISIWGPTHYYFGFGPLNNEELIIEKSIEECPCRPASIFGKITTSKQQLCAKQSMSLISVEEVLEKTLQALN